MLGIVLGEYIIEVFRPKNMTHDFKKKWKVLIYLVI